MEAILVECVNSSLRRLMFRNAIFLCERLCDEFSSEVNLQLLAACYLQNNQAYAAYRVLKGMQMDHSRYLFAFACFQLGLLSEAESTLCPAIDPSLEVPNGASGNYLMGLVYRYTDRRKNAIHHFQKALALDPLMFVAYEELCILGAADEASKIFGESAAHFVHKQYMTNALPSLQTSIEERNKAIIKASNAEDISPRHLKQLHAHNIRDVSANCSVNHSSLAGASIQTINCGPTHSLFYNTPSPMVTQLSGVAPPPVCRNFAANVQNSNAPCADVSPKLHANINALAIRRKFVDEGKLRKISGRLFSDSGPRRSTRTTTEAPTNNSFSLLSGANNNAKYVGNSKLSSVALRSVTLRKGQSWSNENCDEVPPNESIDDLRAVNSSNHVSSSPGENKPNETEEPNVAVAGVILSPSEVFAGALALLNLLKIFGEGYRLSCLYKSQDALDCYMKLPPKHFNTGWVLCQVGKAHFELVDYLEADRAFNLARQVCPYSLEGMDVYSTVLYHLKEDMKLSYLAQELLSTDRLAAQTCLQKDHESALKIFQRAVQVNPRYPYGHTLCGHEYVALEDFESGIRSYQSALKVDSRHYNAWYGLGMVYLRQEKFEFSEHHFRMAYRINSRSSVIMTYLGMALHSLKRNVEALEMMEKAIIADKKNPLPMYQKANILVTLDHLDQALQVLQDLKEYAPRESSVYALMGRIFKKLNRHDRAILHFGLALDMKPCATDVATIKAAIEKLHVPDDFEDTL